MPNAKADAYAQKAISAVTMSGANTVTFQQIRFGIGTFQSIGLLIHRVEWYPAAGTLQEIVAAADTLEFALTNRDDLTALSMANQNVYCMTGLSIRLVGAIVSMLSDRIPIVQSFDTLPGGGLLVPANPLYAGLDSTGFAAAGYARVVVWFTFKQLSDKDYLELLQSMIPANI